MIDKRILKICVAIAILVGIAQTPVYSDDDQKKVDPVTADLDGDGIKEKISVKIEKPFRNEMYYILTVGKAKLRTRYEEDGTVVEFIKVVDIDKRDKYKEIVVDTSMGADNTHSETIYQYRNGKIIKLDSFDQSLEFPGNGFIYQSTWADFYSRTHKYTFDKTTKKFKQVKQPFYYVGLALEVKKSFSIYSSQKLENRIAKLKVGPKAIILLESEKGFLIKSSSGLVGWAERKDVRSSMPIPNAG